MSTEIKPNRTTTGQPMPLESVHSVSPSEVNYQYPNRRPTAGRVRRESSFDR
jgi:hypothetical protein